MSVCVKLSLSLGSALRAVALKAEQDINLETVITARDQAANVTFKPVNVDGPVSEDAAGCPYVVFIGNWESVSAAKADEGPPPDRPSIFISIGGGVVARSGDSVLVPLAHTPTVFRRWPDIAKSFGWQGYAYILHNADVQDLYHAWEGLENKDSPIAVVNSLPPSELASMLEGYPSEFAGGQIWVHVYSKQLCYRPFEPTQAAGSTDALYPELLPLDASLWPMYEEYGLLPAAQCGNITNLHVLTCPAVSDLFKRQVRDIVQPSPNEVTGLVDTYDAALVYDAMLLSSALAVQAEGLTKPGAGDSQRAMNELQKVSLRGASGDIAFEINSNSVQRATAHSRVSILSRISSGSIEDGPPYLALNPTAYLHIDDARPRVSDVPGSEYILWPDGTFFPPDIPGVSTLDAATGAVHHAVAPIVDDNYNDAADSRVIAAAAVAAAVVLCACVACAVWYCCFRARRRRSGVGGGARSKAPCDTGRELSGDPLAVSGMQLTAPLKSGGLAGAEDDGLVGVNYVRAMYHDLSGEPLDDTSDTNAALKRNVMSWMCGAKESTSSSRPSSFPSSRISRLASLCTDPRTSGDPDDAHWGAGTSRHRYSSAARHGRSSLTAEPSNKPQRSQPSVTGSGHMALQGAPVQGEIATMVITDVQSSAKLTNSMPAAMSADQELHDRLLRRLMLLYNGIEVATEGDSFHMQLMLHSWSTSASGNCSEDVGLVTVPDEPADCPLPLAMQGLAEKKCPQNGNSRVIFDGLRVRMGGHTDFVSHHRFDQDKNQHHYAGNLFETTRAVAESGSGGQIVFSQATIRAVQSLAHVSSSRYGDVVLMHEGRHYLTAPSPTERDLSTHFRRSLLDQAAHDAATPFQNASSHHTQHSALHGGAPPTGSSGVTGMVNMCLSADTSGLLSGVSAPVGEGVSPSGFSMSGVSAPVGEDVSASGFSMSGSLSGGSFHTQAAGVLQAALRLSPRRRIHSVGDAGEATAHACATGAHAVCSERVQRHPCSLTPRSFEKPDYEEVYCETDVGGRGGGGGGSGTTMHGRHVPSRYVQLNSSLWGCRRESSRGKRSGPVAEGAVESTELPPPVSPSATAFHISTSHVHANLSESAAESWRRARRQNSGGRTAHDSSSTAAAASATSTAPAAAGAGAVGAVAGHPCASAPARVVVRTDSDRKWNRGGRAVAGADNQSAKAMYANASVQSSSSAAARRAQAAQPERGDVSRGVVSPEAVELASRVVAHLAANRERGAAQRPFSHAGTRRDTYIESWEAAHAVNHSHALGGRSAACDPADPAEAGGGSSSSVARAAMQRAELRNEMKAATSSLQAAVRGRSGHKGATAESNAAVRSFEDALDWKIQMTQQAAAQHAKTQRHTFLTPRNPTPAEVPSSHSQPQPAAPIRGPHKFSGHPEWQSNTSSSGGGGGMHGSHTTQPRGTHRSGHYHGAPQGGAFGDQAFREADVATSDVANISRATHPPAAGPGALRSFPQHARTTPASTSTGSSCEAVATGDSWSSAASGATAPRNAAADVAPASHPTRGATAPLGLSEGAGAAVGENVVQQNTQQRSVAVGWSLGKRTGEKMEQQARMHDQQQPLAAPGLQFVQASLPSCSEPGSAVGDRDRTTDEINITEPSAATSSFTSPPPPLPSPLAVMRADACMSEIYPSAQPLSQSHRRTSDPSGRNLAAPSPPIRGPHTSLHTSMAQGVIAIPTGTYRRPSRTTGNIHVPVGAEYRMQAHRKMDATPACIRTMIPTSGSAEALCQAAPATLEAAGDDGARVARARSLAQHERAAAADTPPRPVASAPSVEVPAAALIADAQRAVWEPWSRRVSALSFAARTHAGLACDAVSPSASSVAGRAAIVQELYTVTPEYLKPRHAYFPPLSTKLRITPSFAEAPRDGDITICYTFITHIKEINAWSVAGAKAVVRTACALIRDTLVQYSGYEVRENSGNFLLSFGVPEDALGFCIAAQKAFMHHTWDEDLLKLPIACAHKDVCGGSEAVFRGPRIHCGLSSGSFADGCFTAVVPDARTGRAQYQGTLCNHAARVASVAHGGQIVASSSSVTAYSPTALEANGVQLKDLGLFGMKGFGGEHRIWQVEDSELARRVFPEGPPSQAGKVVPIPKRPGGMLSSLRKRLRRSGGSGGGGAAAAVDLGKPEFLASTLNARISLPLARNSAHSSVTSQAIKLSSRSIRSGSADADDAAVLTGDIQLTAVAAAGHPSNRGSATAAPDSLAGGGLFPSQRRPGQPRAGSGPLARKKAPSGGGTGPGTATGGSTGANSVFGAGPSASGPSASSERMGPLAISFDSATVLSDETAWLSTAYNQHSSLLSDVRTSHTPKDSGGTTTATATPTATVTPAAFSGSPPASGEDGDGRHPQAHVLHTPGYPGHQGNGASDKVAPNMHATSPQTAAGAYAPPTIVKDLPQHADVRSQCAVATLVATEASTVANDATASLPIDPGFGSCVELPVGRGTSSIQPADILFAASPTSPMRGDAADAPSAATATADDEPLFFAGPAEGGAELQRCSSGSLRPGEGVFHPPAAAVATAYASTPYPASLTASWLAGGATGRGSNGGASGAAGQSLPHAQPLPQKGKLHADSPPAHDESARDVGADVVALQMHGDEGARSFSVTLNRIDSDLRSVGDFSGDPDKGHDKETAAAHPMSSGTAANATERLQQASPRSAGRPVYPTECPTDPEIAAAHAMLQPSSAFQPDSFTKAFPKGSRDDDAGEGPVEEPELLGGPSRPSVCSCLSELSGSSLSPMALPTHSGNMELLLGDFLPSQRRRKLARGRTHGEGGTAAGGGGYEGTSGDTSNTPRDPGTPATPAVEQGTEDDEEDVNFVLNFDHFGGSKPTRGHGDARKRAVQMSAGAAGICLDSLDHETALQLDGGGWGASAAAHAAASADGAAVPQPPVEQAPGVKAPPLASAQQLAARPHSEPAMPPSAAAAGAAGGSGRLRRPATLPQPTPQPTAVPQVDLNPWLPISSESPRLPGNAAVAQGPTLHTHAHRSGSVSGSGGTSGAAAERPGVPPPQGAAPLGPPAAAPLQMAGVDAFVTGAPTLPALQLALQFCDTAMDLTDVSGRLLHVNPKWVDLTGYAAEDVVGSFISDLISESNGFFASTTLQNGVPAPGVVTDGIEHMKCMRGGRMWHSVCRVTIPVEAQGSAAPPHVPCTLVILSRRIDMSEELARRYAVDL